METKQLNIYQRLLAISTEIEKVAKNLTVKAGNETYKAVGEGDVLVAVKPLEDSYGVYSYPLSREILESGIHETKSGTKMLFMREKVVYRFVNVDKPEEYVDMESIGDGVDSQDKAPGKAATYADKYALLKAYKAQTGEDPDANGSEEMGDHKKRTTNHTKAETPKTETRVSDSKWAKLKDICEQKGVNFNKATNRVDEVFHKRVNDLDDEEWDKVYQPIAEMPDVEVQSQ